ncbi:CotY/CotZ family spore coat protein [Aquibacillus sp. 3ASR75-11]|uniref:CotY/CotZ family spore coat protein n=1 Tax=Terrihalobacillus insolitus TaxID=2950438 RepID=A0A9X4AN91_9BACI|nr:CotY/CotZ family spore coat protein [Terrihalobacillus insolitus]MDC3426176.1 CotY/CotZ family spore coat protein [Terrihalobacillus insolitus]
MSVSHREECVCDVVREIVRAQDAVTNNNDCCTTSCENSIRDLLSPSQVGNVNTTIPFILYCKDCDPFISSGVFQGELGESGNTFFGCVETPIFRAKKFVEGSDCCVKLELLLPVTEGGSTPGPTESGVSDVCKFFPGRSVRGFQATGICLTVDLNCFCGITCLDPISPIPASQFPSEED